MIEFHFCPTPNCYKIAIMLREIGAPYRVVAYDLYAGGHLSPQYRAINPNLKLPAIVDLDPAGGGAPVPVFESGAILIYLAEKSGRFLPVEPRLRTRALQWLIWQVAGLGPMFGQASHFIRYAPAGQEYGRTRYVNEANRLAHVLDGQLAETEYLAGAYSVADMAVWPWLANGPLVGLDLDGFANIRRWHAAIGRRPAVQAVFDSPETAIDPRYLQPDMVLTAEEWSNTMGDRMLAAVVR